MGGGIWGSILRPTGRPGWGSLAVPTPQHIGRPCQVMQSHALSGPFPSLTRAAGGSGRATSRPAGREGRSFASRGSCPRRPQPGPRHDPPPPPRREAGPGPRPHRALPVPTGRSPLWRAPAPRPVAPPHPPALRPRAASDPPFGRPQGPWCCLCLPRRRVACPAVALHLALLPMCAPPPAFSPLQALLWCGPLVGGGGCGGVRGGGGGGRKRPCVVRGSEEIF